MQLSGMDLNYEIQTPFCILNSVSPRRKMTPKASVTGKSQLKSSHSSSLQQTSFIEVEGLFPFLVATSAEEQQGPGT